VLSVLGASVDRWIANAIVARARRRWLLARLVPATCIRPLVNPAATVIRRRLSRAAVTTMATAGFLIAVLLLVGR
jgi:hypothetical protein